jgi:tRNA(fMet)-specific endonuclease VapC
MSQLLLDSGPVILHLRGHRHTVRLIRELSPINRLAISAVTRLEVRARMQSAERFATQKLLSRFMSYDFDKNCADRAGDLINMLRQQNISIAVPDAMIAATALVHNLTLVTFNRAHFAVIPGLSLYPLPQDEN